MMQAGPKLLERAIERTRSEMLQPCQTWGVSSFKSIERWTHIRKQRVAREARGRLQVLLAMREDQ